MAYILKILLVILWVICSQFNVLQRITMLKNSNSLRYFSNVHINVIRMLLKAFSKSLRAVKKC